MFKELVKKTIKLFQPINLEELGYFKIDNKVIDIEHMINQGILNAIEPNPEVHIFFERKNENGLNELLILNNERIVYAIFINNNIIYKKKYESFYKYHKRKLSILKGCLSLFDNSRLWIKYYLDMPQKKINNLILISNYAKSANNVLNYRDIHDGPVFYIKEHLSEIDVYYLVDSDSHQPNGESDLKVLKVIGETLYGYSDGELKSLSNLIKQTGLSFEKNTVSWLTHPDPSPDISQNSSSLELNFNNKSLLYIKIQRMRYHEKEVNFVMFKNPHKKNMLDYSAVNILNNQDIFEIIAVDYASDSDINGLCQLSNANEYFMSESSVKKFVIKELFTECLTKESRESLGFKPSGDLDDREMMIVEALTI